MTIPGCCFISHIFHHLPFPVSPPLKNKNGVEGEAVNFSLLKQTAPCPSCVPGFTFCFSVPARLVLFIDNTQFLGDIFIWVRVQIYFCSCRSFSSPLSSMCWELISTLVHLCLMGTFILCPGELILLWVIIKLLIYCLCSQIVQWELSAIQGHWHLGEIAVVSRLFWGFC